MPRSKILVDSNSYFRLAKSIHPLLDSAFGRQEYCLYVLQELEREYDKNPRLQTKFSWVNDDEFFENRKKKLTISKREMREIARAEEILYDYKNEKCLGVSLIDVNYLAHAYVLDIPVVTDDKDMLELAKAFDIKTMKSLKLLHLMLKSGHINMQKVREVASYWVYTKDTPGNFRNEYKDLFNEELPAPS